MGTWYVDNTLHGAANALGTATGGGTGFILLQNAGVQADGEFNGYGILITSGRGAGQQRRIVDYDHSGHPDGERRAAVSSSWAVTPDGTSTYEITVGCDANSGAGAGAGATGAWRTVDAAMNAVAAMGTGPQSVYVKGGRVYAETATIDTSRTAGHTVTFEGYVETPGDGGRFTLDGGGVRGAGLNSAVSGAVYYVLRNAAVVNCTAHGIDLGGVSAVRLVNCAAIGNGGNGLSLGQDNILVGCEASGNAANGFSFTTSTSTFGSVLMNCRARGNANNQYRGGSMLLVACTADGLASDRVAIYAQLAVDAVFLINCTIDGTGSSGATGLYLTTGVRHLVVNTIFSNLSKGVQASLVEPMRLARNNLFFNCPGGEMINYPSDGGDRFADPLFVDASDGDLRSRVGSPALRAGYPEHIDMGSRQHCSRSMIGGPCRRGMQA